MFSLAVKGKRNAQVTEHNDRAWLAWYTAYMPHMKRPVRLPDLTISGGSQKKQSGQSPAQIDTVMRKWRFVMATSGMDTVKKRVTVAR